MILVTLVDFASKAKKINIRWEYNRIDDPLKIPYTGIPFILLGRQQYQYHQAKILTIKRKKTTRRKKPAKLITDHTFTKHQKLVQDTKKRMFSSLQYQKTVYIPKV